MIEGIIWAIIAGLMLGLYALPEKFTKEFEYENTWGTFFTTALFIIPIIAVLVFVNGFSNIMSAIPVDVLVKMGIGSILWGIGIMLWGKAINHIGLSLGFSIFIGTVILVGSLLPFAVDGLPHNKVLGTILVGILVVLIGVVANGKAGMLRHEAEGNEGGENKSMMKGISIAIIGGLFATGFSYANAVGRPSIHSAVLAEGNAEWITAIVIMFVIFVAGGLFVTPYFIFQINKQNLWSRFKTVHIGRNLRMTTGMALLNFAASAAFAYAAFSLGKSGNTIGYAIYNTISVAVAIVCGLVTKEWTNAPIKARKSLYFGLGAMIIGVLIIAVGNGIA